MGRNTTTALLNLVYTLQQLIHRTAVPNYQPHVQMCAGVVMLDNDMHTDANVNAHQWPDLVSTQDSMFSFKCTTSTVIVLGVWLR